MTTTTTEFSSTVPGAIQTLQNHFGNVAAANPDLNAGVQLGVATAPSGLPDNYLMIGDWETGDLLLDYRQDWRGFPAIAGRKSEQYGIPCNLRSWAGQALPFDRLTDAFTLMNGVLSELQQDPNASGSISPSGTWQATEFGMSCGPVEGKGFGVLITFVVMVVNVQLPAS